MTNVSWQLHRERSFDWGGGAGRDSVLFVDYKNVSFFGQLLESIFAVLRLSSNAQ